MDIKILDTNLDVNASIKWASDIGPGCVNMFIGKVRPTASDRKVHYLDFEAYAKMAVQEMEQIATSASKKWDTDKILVHHRTGRVYAGDIPVLIIVSARHRKDAIEACRYIIDTLKSTVPIWKKEVYTNGESWVTAHP
ncbi:molybdenum cofactor biosynthesis protein MoaE [Candidatus Saccharibacteria bacterium]|nr:molybdenum cofactor biosynthesis protein MoaE [Candidatus Saccharibacteria bacterium]